MSSYQQLQHTDSAFSRVLHPLSVMSDALSSEWKKDAYYSIGDRVAFKIGDSLGVAAFECLQAREPHMTYL